MEYKYGLNDNDIPVKENVMYSLQQVIFIVVSAVVMPVAVGAALGLPRMDVAYMLQRTFFLCGVVTIIQLRLGHRYPIIDGPAGLWSGLIIAIASTPMAQNGDAALLRTNLETGMIIAGVFVAVLAALGLINKIMRLFTPLINGVLMLIMSLQISASIAKGMLGINTENSVANPKSFIVFSITLLIILMINYRCRGFIQSIATFIGVGVGWLFAVVIGESKIDNLFSNGFFSAPKTLAWGNLTFDPGITVTCVIGAFVLISTVLASINGMAETLNEKTEPKQIKKAMIIHGFATVLAGVFSTIAFMPYVSSTGVVQMTGVASRKPLYCASACMIIMGMFCPVGAFFACIPGSVGNAALLTVFALILGSALKEFKKVNFSNRENFVVGMSVLLGTGVMFLPSEAFNALPQIAGCLLSNGLIDGMIVAFFLEHIILYKKNNLSE